jgi:hypothetical protein
MLFGHINWLHPQLFPCRTASAVKLHLTQPDIIYWGSVLPQSITIAAFVFGAVLLLIAIMGGGFKLFGAEVAGKAGILMRLVAGMLGLFLILFGIFGSATERNMDQGSISAPNPNIPLAADKTAAITQTPSKTKSPQQQPSPLPPNGFTSHPALPASTCPVLQGMIWLQNPNLWYGPFAGGEGLSFSSAGGFNVWDPKKLNIYGSFGAVITYPDPYLQIQRNVWVPLQQSRFSVCVDGYGNVFGLQK